MIPPVCQAIGQALASDEQGQSHDPARPSFPRAGRFRILLEQGGRRETRPDAIMTAEPDQRTVEEERL